MLACLLLAITAPSFNERCHYLYIEAEQFSDLGGWLLESQFIDQMGSSYLLAQGLAGPVEDARTTVDLPAAGIWSVWVRTKNWCADVEPAPGRFVVRWDDRETSVLGAGAAEWGWEYGGTFHRRAGRVALALHDLTGEYGRCDALLLTDDPAFQPGAGDADYRALRAALTGVDGDFHDRGEWDVVVVGGGIAGCAAAVCAARHGARTCLIQDRPVLGGNASDEVRVGVAGASANRARYSREAGVIEEFAREAKRLGSWSKGLQTVVEATAGLDLILNHRAVGARADHGRIDAVTVREVRKSQGWLIRGKVFIDCTGDGCVGYAAGADYRVGREGRAEYGESIAPEEPDRTTLGSTLLFGSRDTGAPVEYHPPAWARSFPGCDSLPYRNHAGFTGGQWWIEYGNRVDTIADAEAIRDELLRIVYGYWGHIKNSCEYSEKARNRVLSWVGTVAGKRESRRLLGDYVLRQQDVETPTDFPDKVAYGGWPIDLHVDIYDPGPPNIAVPVPLYSIPFRCLYSRNIANLLMAGRDISVSHVALGTTRVMGTCGTQGQAVGTAAALCVRYGLTPRELGQTRIAELQRLLLRDDAHLLGMALREPENLALRAHVTASSAVPDVPYGLEAVQPADKHACDQHDRAVMLPCPSGRVDTAYLLLENGGRQDLPVRILVRGAAAGGAFAAGPDLAVSEAVVPPGRHWVRYPLDQTVPTPFVWFVVPKTKGLFWWLTNEAPQDAARAYSAPGRDEWQPAGGVYALYVDPAVPLARGCAPAGVVDAWTRPTGGDYRGWISDPEQSLPQWVELRWDAPQRLARVELVFDTNLQPRAPLQLIEEECAKDYVVEAEVDGSWREVARAAGNYHRLRVHSFAPVTAAAVRLTIGATGGGRTARVFEFRAYGP